MMERGVDGCMMGGGGERERERVRVCFMTTDSRSKCVYAC